MIDNHVHIGQFKDVYYDPLEIMDIVLSCSMEGMSFSSTSTCKAGILYQEIEKEISGFLSQISYNAETVRPFFWYIPEYINKGITMENAITSIPYKGIKLHPFAHHWNFDDKQHVETLHSLFDYAAMNNLPILIHTGHSGVDHADRFERFFAEYPNAKCILAHCRPLDTTIKMLKKYTNAFCDTAFTTDTEIKKIIAAGFKDKIIFGTDFPITHYFITRFPGQDNNSIISLKEKYTEDITETAYTRGPV